MFRFPSSDRPIFLEKKKLPKSLVKKQVNLNWQAHDLVSLTPIVLNYHPYFIFVAFLDNW